MTVPIESLLIDVAAAQALILAVAFVVMFAHGLLVRARTSRDGARLARVHRDLAATLQLGGAADPAPLTEVVAALPFRLRVRLLRDVAPSLHGTQRALLAAAMARCGVTAKAEQWCGSRRWPRRLEAVRVLTLLQAGQHVVPQLLDDVQQDVRAEAIQWAVEHPREEVVARLLDSLATGRRAESFALKDALVRIGQPTLAPLIPYITTQRGEQLQGGLEVAVALADPRMLAPALAATGDASPRTRALAAALTAALGGKQAVSRLVEMLEDEEPEVRAAAAKAVGQLGYWAAAPKVAALLRDPAWIVRRRAALALRALGAPGALLLRRALRDDDGFARDAARQVLDLPERQTTTMLV